MKYIISPWKRCALVLCFTFSLLVIHAFAFSAAAQEKRAIKGEMATCQIDVTEMGTGQSTAMNVQRGKGQAFIKSHKPLLDQVGYFDRVSNIQPMQKLTVQTVYTKGRAGEKVAIIVLDGGMLDNNKREKISQLDNKGKLVFGFQAASDPGIYRIMLRKGIDTKVVQIWVGPEPLPVKN